MILLLRAPILATMEPRNTGDDPLLAQLEAEFAGQAVGFPDPLEGLNRHMLRLNQTLDYWLIDPLATAYGFIVPNPAKFAVRRFFANLDAPPILINDLLQGEFLLAATTVTRFAVNTIVGIGGLFDAAAPLGLERHWSDFGQTMAVYGVPSGPYLVMPVFGPTTLRDGTGTLVSVMFRPTTYLLGPAEQLVYTGFYGGGSGIVTREENADALHAMESSSVDFYAALRNAYYQVRIAEIWRGRDPGTVADDKVTASPPTRDPNDGAAPSTLAREFSIRD